MTSRRRVLLGLLAALVALAAATLWEVLGTVFFAITVVYVAGPVYRELLDRGLAPWWASAVTTALVYASALAVFAPFAVVLYQRRRDLIAFIRALPESVTVAVGDVQYVLLTGELLAAVTDWLTDVAVGIARAAPVLALKLTLFGVVVFALLIRQGEAERALIAAVPPQHRGIARALNERARETLVAIYVLQAATGLGTFLVAFPLFFLLGYQFAFVLALLAGLLQFLPIVGPSLVIGALALADLVADNVARALLVAVIGGVLVAWLPDLLVRPRLAERTADVPGSLYFIGFVGGLLTLGPVGVVAGPVVVVLLHEALGLLAAETGPVPEDSPG